MKYQEAVTFHEKAKEYGSILGLDTIRNLMQVLQDIWKELNIIHIAGTNGKGSVCCFLASVLKEAGYTVGQFNSPAVFAEREVYRINGEMISEDEYAECMKVVADACRYMVEKGLVHPTVFEIDTALAFVWFCRRKCDIVLLEVGMGGSTDATNVIEHPLCSVLTSISMDHMQFLGNSLEEIANVKAGIIKEGCPVVSAKQRPEVTKVLKERAMECGSKYYEAADISVIDMDKDSCDRVVLENLTLENLHGICYEHPVLHQIELGMHAEYQMPNSALAIETLLCLREQGYDISEEDIKVGLKNAYWQGRFEYISKQPLIVIDGAHNPDAVIQLKATLENQYADKKKIGIMGVMADKPYEEMLDIIMSEFDVIYTVTPDNPRALPAEELAKVIDSKHGRGVPVVSVREAVRLAMDTVSRLEDAIIMVFGSLYYLAQVKEAVKLVIGDRND